MMPISRRMGGRGAVKLNLLMLYIYTPLFAASHLSNNHSKRRIITTLRFTGILLLAMVLLITPPVQASDSEHCDFDNDEDENDSDDDNHDEEDDFCPPVDSVPEFPTSSFLLVSTTLAIIVLLRRIDFFNNLRTS